MSLRSRLALATLAILIATSAAAAVLVVQQCGAESLALACGATCAAILFTRQALLRGAMARYVRAFDTAEPFEVRRLAAEIMQCLKATPAVQVAFAAGEGALLAKEGKHREGRAVLEGIDRAPLDPATKAAVLNNLAWVMALGGDARAALPLADEALATAPPATTADARGRYLGTRGVARVLAGELDGGVRDLETVLAAGGTQNNQATRAFYLGEGLRALGHHLEARAAYERACREAPESAEGKRARAALDAFHAQPFRA